MLAFLNNPASQGDFDTELLAALNLDFGIDFADMGFSKMDVDYLFDGDARFSELFVDDAEAKNVGINTESAAVAGKADRRAQLAMKIRDAFAVR